MTPVVSCPPLDNGHDWCSICTGCKHLDDCAYGFDLRRLARDGCRVVVDAFQRYVPTVRSTEAYKRLGSSESTLRPTAGTPVPVLLSPLLAAQGAGALPASAGEVDVCVECSNACPACPVED